MPVKKKTSKKKNTPKKKEGKSHSGNKPSAYQQVPHSRRPDNMSDKEWQTALRRQMAEKEKFTIKNLDHQPVYSDYSVYSPVSKNTYKVALRSRDNSLNFCSCPDFKTNQLGTCKHIESVRTQLNRKRGIRQLLDKVPMKPYSSLYVSCLGERKLKLRVGTDHKKKFEQWAGKYFDKQHTLLPAAYFQIEQLLKEAYGIDPSFCCYEDALQMIVAGRDQARRQSLVEKQGVNLLKDLVNVKLFSGQFNIFTYLFHHLLKLWKQGLLFRLHFCCLLST